MKIYDIFTYFKEVDVVKIRFHELFDVVDKFVFIEANQTFRGQSKPFYGEELIASLPIEWQQKIIHLKIEFPDNLTDPWDREAYQRDSVLQLSFDDEDILIFSDADEIIKAKSLTDAVKSLGSDPIYFDNTLYYMNLNLKVPQDRNGGSRPVCIKFKHLSDKPSYIRYRCPLYFGGNLVPNAGWHFSYFGGIGAIKEKISSFSHSEYDTIEFKNDEHLQSCINNGNDLFDRFSLEIVEVDETYPQWIIENINSLKHFLR